MADIWATWPRAVAVHVDGEAVHAQLVDGREITVPIEWFGFLAAGTDAERRNATIEEEGRALFWEDLDESVSVPSLLGLPELLPPDPRVRSYTVDYRKDYVEWVATVRGSDLISLGDTLLRAKRSVRELLRWYLGVKSLKKARIEVADVVASTEPAGVR